MFGIEIGIDDINAAATDFLSIPAVLPLISISLALPLVALVVRMIRSIVGSR